tara:strand:- start:195988 stop:197067 length:1080 start_codon:yes stop_codon:yes gene_type:complete
MAVIGTLTVLGGCATQNAPSTESSMLQRQLDEAKSAAASSAEETTQLRNELARTQSASQKQNASLPAGVTNDMLPPNAQPGHCYARVLIPAEYAQGSETVTARAASQRIDVIPAKYEFVEERVLSQEASTRLEIVPASYKTVTEKLMIEPEKTAIREIPAVYESTSERILVKPAYTTWKKGRGPVERLNDSTGEIMCLVEVPAEYKTVSKKVVKTPARTVEDVTPAKYKTVEKRVVAVAETTREVAVPAKYETVQVRKLVTAAETRTVDIPAKYETVATRKQVADSRLEWREILCDTNTTPGLVARLQKALNTAGYNAGPADGILGNDTLAALKAYQRANNMPGGQLTLGVLDQLNVTL